MFVLLKRKKEEKARHPIYHKKWPFDEYLDSSLSWAEDVCVGLRHLFVGTDWVSLR
jgi:hypothetical protein